MTRADIGCCISGRFPINKFVCVVQRDLERYHMAKLEGGKKGKKGKKAKAAGEKQWQENTEPARKDCEGRSLLEMMWEELDAVIERLLSDNPAEDGRDPGRAEGMAICIAIVQQPYNPDIEKVREQSMQRWREKNAEFGDDS